MQRSEDEQRARDGDCLQDFQSPSAWDPLCGELMQVRWLDDYPFQFEFAIPQPAWVASLAHPNQGLEWIKYPKHHYSQFHPAYVGRDTAQALAQEAGFEDWIQHFNHLGRMWSDLPAFNTDKPMINAYVLVERGTDLARFDRNPYYWKIDVEGNQLPYMDGLDVEIVQDTEVTAGKIIAGEATLSGMPWVNGGLANYPLFRAPPGARQSDSG